MMQHLQPNTTLQGGKYRIKRVLGQGGFGITYLARNTVFDIDVAIKEFFMKDENNRDGSSVTMPNTTKHELFYGQMEKFKKEAKRMFAIKNEHIVRVQDLFEENGTAYYVMYYVDGENLSERLKRTGKPMTEQEVRDILPQILDALKSVHDAGIWHLDLKPANIMVDKTGQLKLIDFGASKQLNTQKGGATTSTAISYTNGYAPREQMEQNYDKFGPWTDIYALGATLYNLLTNKRPPLPTDIDDDMSEDKHVAFPFLTTTSKDMKNFVLQMMNTNRQKRPQDINSLTSLLVPKPKKEIIKPETVKDTKENEEESETTKLAPVVDNSTHRTSTKQKPKSPPSELVLPYPEEETWKDKLKERFTVFKSIGIIFLIIVGAGLVRECLSCADKQTKKESVINNKTSESNAEPESVDLGLSVEWATFNIGANGPNEIGDFYQWASTSPVGVDTLHLNSFKKYNSMGMVVDQEDDAAHIVLGNKWRLPTPNELQELVSECTWEESERMGVKGYEVKGKNGKIIFLPYVYSDYENNKVGAYMSNQLSNNNKDSFYTLMFSDETGVVNETNKICVMEISRDSPVVIRPVKDLAYDVVEVMPEYPGGSEALSKYLSESIKYPEEAEEKGIEGKVILTFIVEKDGSISEIEVVNPVNSLLDNEAVRVIESMQGWIPGKQNGKTVRVKYTIPVTFKLQ